jgi:hypothetical protein
MIHALYHKVPWPLVLEPEKMSSKANNRTGNKSFKPLKCLITCYSLTLLLLVVLILLGVLGHCSNVK